MSNCGTKRQSTVIWLSILDILRKYHATKNGIEMEHVKRIFSNKAIEITAHVLYGDRKATMYDRANLIKPRFKKSEIHGDLPKKVVW